MLIAKEEKWIIQNLRPGNGGAAKATFKGNQQTQAAGKKAKPVDHIAQIALVCGYSLKDLIGKAAPAVKSGKARRRKPGAVKYRHPEQAGLKWTGRGRKPNWVGEWLDAGKRIETLAV